MVVTLPPHFGLTCSDNNLEGCKLFNLNCSYPKCAKGRKDKLENNYDIGQHKIASAIRLQQEKLAQTIERNFPILVNHSLKGCKITLEYDSEEEAKRVYNLLCLPKA